VTSGTCAGSGAGCIASVNASWSGDENMVVQMTAGTTYYIVVDAVESGGNDFTLAIRPVQRPANDTCMAPTALPLDTTLSGTLIGASADYGAELSTSSACDNWNGTGADVVYQLAVTAGHSYEVYVSSQTSGVYPFAWVSASCGGTGSACEQVGSSMRFKAASSSTYYVMVDVGGTALAEFTIWAHDLGAAPANDTCSGAQVLALDTVVEGSLLTAGGDYGGTSSSQCTFSDQTGTDVVYQFSPTLTGAYAVELDSDYSHDLMLWVTSGTCAGSGAGCIASVNASWSGDENMVIQMTAGTTYYIVVDAVESGGNEFTLQILRL